MYVLSIEYNMYNIICIIDLGYSMKVIYVFCIIISMKLGKILFIEKLDVIKKYFEYLVLSTIF